MRGLIIAEHNNHALSAATFSVVSAAKQLVSEMDVFIAGFQCQSVVKEASQLPFVKRVFVADSVEYQYQLAENMASLAATLASSYQYIFSAATTTGKNLLPRLAGLLDKAMVSDVIQIINADTFVRPIYAGNAYETVQLLEPIKLLTIRPIAFSPVKIDKQTASIEKIETHIPNSLSHFVKQELNQSVRPDLATAHVVVSGGRGLKSKEQFKLIEQLADQLNGAVGASRAAVDAGFAPNDEQVGQTGKVVAPDLYFAIGISGAIQHIAGMKDSKVIVAINQDAEAPIFEIADYGLVADLFEAVPALCKALNEGTRVK